jgi:hypothetical protein
MREKQGQNQDVFDFLGASPAAGVRFPKGRSFNGGEGRAIRSNLSRGARSVGATLVVALTLK